MTGQTQSRRELYRERTREEIITIAQRQVADGGVESLSLNAIAKQMAVSGAALYRYFASRDDLVAALMVQAYEGLADTLETAAGNRHRSAAERVHAVAAAYRDWAIAQPHRYRLVFATRLAPGHLASTDIVLASQRSMDVFLQVLGSLPATPASSGRAVGADLAAQLLTWRQRSNQPDLPAATLRLGMACWTRLHGILSLELDGHLPATSVDPGLLYHAEVDDLIG